MTFVPIFKTPMPIMNKNNLQYKVEAANNIVLTRGLCDRSKELKTIERVEQLKHSVNFNYISLQKGESPQPLRWASVPNGANL